MRVGPTARLSRLTRGAALHERRYFARRRTARMCTGCPCSACRTATRRNKPQQAATSRNTPHHAATRLRQRRAFPLSLGAFSLSAARIHIPPCAAATETLPQPPPPTPVGPSAAPILPLPGPRIESCPSEWREIMVAVAKEPSSLPNAPPPIAEYPVETFSLALSERRPISLRSLKSSLTALRTTSSHE